MRAAVEAQAKALPSDGETPWDHRQYDAFLGLFRSGASGRTRRADPWTPYFAVFHAPLTALIDESGDPSELVGDLERGGLLSSRDGATLGLRRHLRHRSRRRSTATRCTRVGLAAARRAHNGVRSGVGIAAAASPGVRTPSSPNPITCEWWVRGGKTDLPNLALLCKYHHGLVHSKGWTVSGDANGEIVFVGPSGRALTSRPSPRWTTVSRLESESRANQEKTELREERRLPPTRPSQAMTPSARSRPSSSEPRPSSEPRTSSVCSPIHGTRASGPSDTEPNFTGSPGINTG